MVIKFGRRSEKQPILQVKPNITPNFIKVPTAGGGHKKIQDKTEIANEMNQQFCQMGANLAKRT